jgi:hypothetical protein
MTDSPVLPPVGEGTPVPPGPGIVRAFPIRWAVAGVATVGVIGAVVVGWLLFGQPRVDTASAAWLPSDTVGYVEVSADLTAGERDQVLALLKKFPGFADQANLGDKLDESFQRLFSRVDVDYRGQVKPWLGDSVTLAMRAPPAGASPAPGSAHEQEGVLLVASTNDSAAATFVQALGERAAKAGAAVTSETDQGVAITTVTPASDSAVRRAGALAVVDGRLVAGDADLVHAVVAVRRSGAASLATQDAFRSAIGSLPGDRVGALWLDAAALAAGAREQLQAVSPVAGLLTFSPGSALVGSLRAEDDGLVLELNGRGSIAGAALFSPPPGAGNPHRSRLAASAPAQAAAYLEIHDIGAAAQSALAAARLADPSTNQSIEQLDKTLALAGTTLDQLTAAIGDGALMVTLPAGTSAPPRVALLLEVKDMALATRLVSQADALLGLSGVASVTTRDYRGVTLHRAETTSVTLPGGPGGPTFALAGDVLIVGLDEDLVVSIIDARMDASGLGVDPDYTAVSERIGPENNGALYVDLETLASAFGASSLTAEERAFLAPFRQLGLAVTAPGEHEWLGTSRLFVRIK